MDAAGETYTAAQAHRSDSDSDVTNGVSDQLSALSLCRDEQKDPRRIARKYQMDLCKKALEENVIVYMGTGCGKTHIAVLLIYEMGHLIKKPQKNICVFLAPTVALVEQQAKVIENSVDFKVGIYCGTTRHIRDPQDWEKEMEEYEVIVMTPQKLLHCLSHCFIKIELIALLIFDECHHAQLRSNHEYAEIMKIFYKMDLTKHPRILGMTASPILGKGGSVDDLEKLLRAKVYSVEDKEELEQFVTSAKVNVYYYDSIENGYSCRDYTRKLEEIMRQCMLTLLTNELDQRNLKSAKKSVQKWHGNLIYCLENIGLLGALQAIKISRTGDQYEATELVEGEEGCSDDNLCEKYLYHALLALESDSTGGGTEGESSCFEVLKEPFFSTKTLRLIEVLSNFRLQPDMKCIIFVNRTVTARSLSYILQNIKHLSSWRCGFLLGIHSGLVSRKNTNAILEKFRSGEVNLLVATKVGEEGLDIQTCCLVIRFDLPETVASFIQSRGRARMPQSEYAFLVDRSNPAELNLIENFRLEEARMNEEISTRNSLVAMIDFNEQTYRVDATGATISSVSSVSLLHHYCSKLPHDEYFNPKPQFFYYDGVDGTICDLILPANAPIHHIASSSQPSTEAAKRDACLKAIKSLHEVGALTDYLLMEQDDKKEESNQDSYDSDSGDDENSRGELHEMLVPAALTKPWTELGNSKCFNSYYIEFNPNPADRIYKKIGLFVKEKLPEEAGNMKLDLCLARGRAVMTQLIPSGVSSFDEDEIALAEKFQRMFLKIILDRHEFIPEYVSLADNDGTPSTFYLLLPVIEHDCYDLSVDWDLIRRCLSSPIFRNPRTDTSDEVSQFNSQLHLANGCSSLQDTVNSLVYVPCRDTFYFISDILPEKNGFDSYNESKSHAEHYSEVYNICLVYPGQPLLKAKQLFVLDNLLRKKKHSGVWREKLEHFFELPPEICHLKIIGFSKDIGSSLSLLPSIMHRLENFLVAIELKKKLIASFPEGAEITSTRILEALTTERCSENFSLERLEVLGDSFLKLAVGRHLFLKHDALDEGQLTRKRSNTICNLNLLKLATRQNLQVYVRDQPFEPQQFFAFGRPCPVRCNVETERGMHDGCTSDKENGSKNGVRCNKSHHWLHKKTIADATEALIGAFIVDSGFKAATSFLDWLGVQLDILPSQIHKIYSASNSFLPLADQMDVTALESIIGHKFTHKGLLIQAFVHPSFNSHSGGCYQRLEFLGDAVVDYLVTSYLYTAYPTLKPGSLTDLRSLSVSNASFADVAGQWSFHKFIICDSSDLRASMDKYVRDIDSSASTEGQIEEKTSPKALGDLVESCIGALFLDTGFDLNKVWKITMSLLHPIVRFSRLQFNPLRELTELCQSYNWDLHFSKLKKDGKFSIEAKIDNGNVCTTALATEKSGKAAKRIAAKQLFECLKVQGFKSKTKSLKEVLEESEKMEAKLIGYNEDFHLDARQSDCASSSSNLVSRPAERPPSISGPQGAPSTKSAKSRLYEVCMANCWKPPDFDCFQESGPDHLREYVFKIEMKTSQRRIEIYSGPRHRKKEAAEHAAEGALWFLKEEGYI